MRILEELGWDSNIQVLAREFMELHPGVEITVESDLGLLRQRQPQEEEALRREFTTRLATELAAGEGDYLLFDSGGGAEPGPLWGRAAPWRTWGPIWNRTRT